MRLVWMALLCGAFGAGVPAAAVMAATVVTATAADGAVATGTVAGAGTAATVTVGQPAGLALHECLLEHPLRIATLAARCGTLTVPEDPTRPAGRTIALHVAVVPALDRRSPAPPLFLLAGGPGQSAADLYTSTSAAFARINRNHDIVLLDQRGTGHSAPLVCHYPDDWGAELRDGPAELPRLRTATQSCLDSFGDRVRFYTTSMAVMDLERVRIALGYAQIDLYGSSYGTRVAQLYMRRHEAALGAVVLDGVTYPEQVIGPDTPLDGEHALTLIVERCGHDPSCTAAYPQLTNDLATLRRRFGTEETPLITRDPVSGLPLTSTFGRGMLNGALRFLSYSGTQAALLPTLVHQAAAGDLAPLGLQAIMMSRQLDGLLASGMQNSVICAEDAPYFAAAPVDRALLAQTYQGTDQLDAVTEICKVWPRGPVDADLHAPLHSDVPTLLLSGEADPVTPPRDAERAALGLTHHRSLVLDGEGHGQLATGCIPRVMADFLDHPDPEALDVTCLAKHRPTPFFVRMTGPAP